LRINSGKDDPAGLIASEALRSDIVATQKAISNSQKANQVIATADSALGQVSSLLNDIRGLVTEAANEGALSADQIAANQLQVDSALEAINRIAHSTSFQGKNLLDGTLGFVVTGGANFDAVENLEIDQANLGASGSVTGLTVHVASAATQAQLTATMGGADAAETTLTFDDTGTLTITAVNDGAAYNDYAVSFVETADVAVDAPQVVLGDKTITIYVNDAADTDLADIEAAFDKEWIADQFTATSTAGNYTQGTDDTVTGVTAGGSDNGLSGQVVFELLGNSGSQVFDFANGTTLAQMLAAVNLVSDATGVTAEQGTGADVDKLYFKSAGYGSSATVDINVVTDDSGFESSILDAIHAAGTDVSATVNGVAANAQGNTLSISTSTLSMSMTVAAGTGESAPVDIVFDINGGGALFQLGPDVLTSQQAHIGIQSVSTANLGRTSGKLYMLATGGTAALATDPTLAGSIVEEALGQVSMLRGRLGAFQKTTIDTNIASLQDTLQNLTDAESSIRDADFASETAALTRAQILSQSGLSVLKLANQNPQQVLALLQ
jgi:flagellin